jgi:hypothetical protein
MSRNRGRGLPGREGHGVRRVARPDGDPVASIALRVLFQLIASALRDYDDEFAIDTLAVLSARYAYLAT